MLSLVAAAIQKITLSDLASSISAVVVFGDPSRLWDSLQWPTDPALGFTCQIDIRDDPVLRRNLIM